MTCAGRTSFFDLPSLADSANYSTCYKNPNADIAFMTIYSKIKYISDCGRRAGILAAEVLMGCSGEFFGARELPQLDVGLQVLHHAGELT
jgi:hypothetical protein